MAGAGPGRALPIDWALIAAARLAGRLPRTAAEVPVRRPDCPPEVAVVLRTGQPARPVRRLPPPAPEPVPRKPYEPPRSTWVPGWKPPGDTGPLGESAESARHALRTRTVAFGAREDPAAVTLDHLGAVIERGQLPAFEGAPLDRRWRARRAMGRAPIPAAALRGIAARAPGRGVRRPPGGPGPHGRHERPGRVHSMTCLTWV
ncbi:hypothetical protein ACFVT6_09810 [Streptomyces sp. NPDC058049]|uniref:hypothetical protein n=1 Tax=Streptomyces sp. NPDC058049 TaxID=3346314 RepID=UPI0036E64EFE